MQYGDTRVIEENYDAMCRYIDYLVSTSTDYVRTVQQLGDWLSLEDTPTSLTNTAYCAYSSRLLSIMAEAIGKDEDAARFLQISENYKAAWNREFVLEDGSTVSDSQTSYAIGLVFDLFPEELRETAAQKLVDNIRRRGTHLSTGFLGVSYLNPALSSTGHNDIAFALLEQKEFPSWLYPVVNGATTIYEWWTGRQDYPDGTYSLMESLNHYAYGSVMEWVFRYMLGIERDEQVPGFRHIQLQPTMGGSINWAKGSYDSIYGAIESGWEMKADGYVYKTTIPPGTTATLKLPVLDGRSDYLEGGIPAEEAEGVQVTGVVDNVVVMELASGHYEFLLDLGEDTQAPSTPANLSYNDVIANSANISWNASEDNRGVIGYRVYLDGTMAGEVSAPSYALSGLSADTEYTVEVTAYDKAGNESEPAAITLRTTAWLMNQDFDGENPLEIRQNTYNKWHNLLSVDENITIVENPSAGAQDYVVRIAGSPNQAWPRMDTVGG